MDKEKCVKLYDYICKQLVDFDFNDLSREDLDRYIEESSIHGIKDTMWDMYSFIADIIDFIVEEVEK